MRVGINPAKAGLPAYAPKRLGVALIVYIPVLEGYFQNSLEIFRYQLASLKAATGQEFDLLVFNNGSCPEASAALEALYQDGQIDWLIQSAHNLGKAGAWNWIFAAMPNELICYADSDVLFRPGWLEASLEVLEAFPQAGMIAAQPNFFDVLEGAGTAHVQLAGQDGYSLDEYRPAKEIIDEYCYGIGATDETAQPFYQKPLPAITNHDKNVQAVIGASHMQFVIPREVARQVVPLPAAHALLRRETMSLDHKVDQSGYLHLSTLKPYVFHMGNTVNDRLLQELQRITGGAIQTERGIAQRNTPQTGVRRIMASLARRPRFNRLFRRLYNLLFQALNAE
jgi:glycosyltransferase involved in cell wall biosynthesis